MIRNSDRVATKTGGREAATRHIPPKLALAVGLPSTPAPVGWEWRQLSDLARLESGHTPSRRHPEYWGGSVPWISIRDAKANHGSWIDETDETINDLGLINSSARLIPSGAVCLSRTASVGYVVVTGKPMATSQDFVNWICGADLEPRFLQYLFLAEGEDLLRFASGAVHQTIYFPEAKAFSVCVPGIEVQRRIVAILDDAFEAIATAKANAEKNLQNARELFASHLHSVFSRPRDGWATRTVQQLVDDGVLAKPQDGNHGEIHPTKADYVSSGVPFIMAADLVNGGVDTEGCRFIEDKQARGLRIGFARSGDLLLSHKGTIGRVGILEMPGEYVVLTPQVTYYRSMDSGRLFNGFLYFCLLSPAFQAEMNRIAGAGSTRAYIGITRQLDLQIVLPPVAVQRALADQLSQTEEASRSLAEISVRKLAALDDLKKSLLHQAFTGAL